VFSIEVKAKMRFFSDSCIHDEKKVIEYTLCLTMRCTEDLYTLRTLALRDAMA
jgi:hypothetical protein